MNNKIKALQASLKEARGVLKTVKTDAKEAKATLRTMVKEHNILQKPSIANARIADRVVNVKQGIVDKLLTKIQVEKDKLANTDDL